jgi:hypothetical protein
MANQQTAVLQEILRRAVPGQQPRVPVQEPEHLQRLKENDPALYQTFKAQEDSIKRLRATAFQQAENEDRRKMIEEFGDEGKKYLDQVEQKLADLRSQNIHAYDRGQIFYHLKGQESVKAMRTKPAVVAEIPAPSSNAPSSNPGSAGTLAGSSASPSGAKKTIEELEASLGDYLL